MGEPDILIKAVLVLGKDKIQVAGSLYMQGIFLPWALRGLRAPFHCFHSNRCHQQGTKLLRPY